MAGQRDVEVRRRTLPLNYLCVCFAGNVSHPAKVRDGDVTSSWLAWAAVRAASSYSQPAAAWTAQPTFLRVARYLPGAADSWCKGISRPAILNAVTANTPRSPSSRDGFIE